MPFELFDDGGDEDHRWRKGVDNWSEYMAMSLKRESGGMKGKVETVCTRQRLAKLVL